MNERSDRARTIPELVKVALEGLSGDSRDLMRTPGGRGAIRSHLRSWIKDYAAVRGVIFEDADLEVEIAAAMKELGKR